MSQALLHKGRNKSITDSVDGVKLRFFLQNKALARFFQVGSSLHYSILLKVALDKRTKFLIEE